MTSLNVLIIEDNALNVLLLTELLASMGHAVCATAATEGEAIAAARRHKPDLILADSQLRDGTGISAVEEIIRTAPIPHIFMSGDAAGVARCHPAAIVLKKPFDPLALTRAIESALKVSAAC
jgi:two-component system, response regulator PdtaR